jgi:hypothetical protein
MRVTGGLAGYATMVVDARDDVSLGLAGLGLSLNTGGNGGPGSGGGGIALGHMTPSHVATGAGTTSAAVGVADGSSGSSSTGGSPVSSPERALGVSRDRHNRNMSHGAIPAALPGPAVGFGHGTTSMDRAASDGIRDRDRDRDHTDRESVGAASVTHVLPMANALHHVPVTIV